MDIRKLDDRVSIGGQLSPADLPRLKAAGFRSVICNRPDGEGWGQPRQAEIRAAAEAAGLGFRYVPVTPGPLGEATVADFAKALAELPGPVFAYCRSGARSGNLWSICAAQGG